MVSDELPRDLPSFLAQFGTDASAGLICAPALARGLRCAGCGHGAAYQSSAAADRRVCGLRQAAFAAGRDDVRADKTGGALVLAIWLVTSSKGGISAMELQRQMGCGS